MLLAACGDDGAADPTDASTSSTTSSGTAPTTSVDTTSASLDTSGTGSSTAPSESSSDGGESSSTGEPPGELDPMIAECLRVSACEADGGDPLGLQACLAHALDVPWRWASTGAQRLALDALDCKLAADDCETVRACTPALDAFVATCGENPGGDACDGDTWVLCAPEGAPLAALDCTAAGLSCNDDIWAGCGADPCTFGVTEPSCDGDVLTQCSPSGHLEQIDCATQYNYVIVNGPAGEEVYAIAGETCGFDEMMSGLGCVGTGEPCGFFEQSCDGTVLETCAGGRLAQRDCATLEPDGQSCGFWQAGPFGGAATCGYVEPACSLDADESCDAGVIGFCAYDEVASFDCTAAGYSGCTTAERDGRTIAYCVA